MTQVARQSGQAIMAHTFTGKMFSMRNNSLKAQAGHNNGQNTSGHHHGINNLVGEKSGSVQLNSTSKTTNNTINIQNFTQMANSTNNSQARGGNAGGPNGQGGSGGPNMNLLLTQFFPNNNYTARH